MGKFLVSFTKFIPIRSFFHRLLILKNITDKQKQSKIKKMAKLPDFDLTIVSIFIIVLSIAQFCGVVALGIVFYIRMLKAKESLELIGKYLRSSLEPLYKAYCPIFICLLIMKKYYKVEGELLEMVEDVKSIYKDAERSRGGIVLDVFGKDELSDEFIEKYQSRFIKYGFDGEQAFLYEPSN